MPRGGVVKFNYVTLKLPPEAVGYLVGAMNQIVGLAGEPPSRLWYASEPNERGEVEITRDA